MKVRLPFAAAFFVLLLLTAYAGLTSLQVDVFVNDKLLHFLTFFLLTLVFYWVLDTNRRRTIHLTVVVCTLALGVGSEIFQGLLPNGRQFDLYDIMVNVVGSLAGLGLCSLYHRRMLERKRLRRGYHGVAGEDLEDADLELGEGVGAGAHGAHGAHEEGILDGAGVDRLRTMGLEEGTNGLGATSIAEVGGKAQDISNKA